MTWQVILAVLAGAMLHAGWNVSVKSSEDKTLETGASGDLYIQRSGNPDLFQCANSTWRQVGTDVTGTLTHRAKGSSTVLRYQYLLHGSTTDATPTQLTIDGISEKVLIPSDCVGFFDTQIMGVAEDGSDQVSVCFLPVSKQFKMEAAK